MNYKLIIITAAVVLAALINVLNEVSGQASAVADIKTCTTVEACEREIAQLRAENKNFAAEIKSLGAKNKNLGATFDTARDHAVALKACKQ